MDEMEIWPDVVIWGFFLTPLVWPFVVIIQSRSWAKAQAAPKFVCISGAPNHKHIFLLDPVVNASLLFITVQHFMFDS